MVIACVVIVGVVALGGGCCIALCAARHRPTAHERAGGALRGAMEEVDDALFEARIRMEEAVGRRRPGERRFGDGLRSSWRDW